MIEEKNQSNISCGESICKKIQNQSFLEGQISFYYKLLTNTIFSFLKILFTKKDFRAMEKWRNKKSLQAINTNIYIYIYSSHRLDVTLLFSRVW